MSAAPLRRRLAVTAAASSTALLLAACSSTATNPPQTLMTATPNTAATSTPTVTPAPSAPATEWAAGTPLISDGSATVGIGGVPVTFPTKVSEAAWSPDGSRIAFIDGDGNVSTARPDGSSLVVLVKPAKKTKLSDPVWDDGVVIYVEQSPDGTHGLRSAAVPDQTNHDDYDTAAFVGQDFKPLPDTSEPAAAEYSDIDGDYAAAAFEHQGTKGPEIWIHTFDSNSRGGANPAVKAFDGSWPAIGGHDIAFVGVNGQIEVGKDLPEYSSTAQSVKAVQITTAAVKPTHLTWTADGKSVAYSTPTGIESVSVDSPNATPTEVSAKPGVVSYLPAATDQLVTFTGTDAADLTGASIALSKSRWATETATTPAPAGGGPHGPFAMTVTLVVGTDPTAARRQADWAGMYGPTLVVKAGALDARVTEEIKRVLGKAEPADPADPNSSDMDVDKVFVVDPSSVIPKSTDAAIQSLGYAPVRVTEDPATKQESRCLLVADPDATADIALATGAGCHVMTLASGALSTADAQALPGLSSYGIVATSPAAASAVRKIASAVAGWDPHIVTLSATPSLSDFTVILADARHATTLTVIPAGSPKDALLARAEELGATVVVDPAQGVSPTLKAFLEQYSASINTVNVSDTDSKLGADLRKQIGTLISGPLGPMAVTNPTADARPKAF